MRTVLSRTALFLGFLCVTLGCSESPNGLPEDASVSKAPPSNKPSTKSGLTARSIADQTMDKFGSPHLGDILVHGEHVYIANSHSVIATFYLGPDHSIEPASSTPGNNRSSETAKHCTALTLHAPSATLFCVDPLQWIEGGLMPNGEGTLVVIDVSDPGNPMLRDQGQRSMNYRMRDAVVHGDTLIMAAFGEGLRMADIAADGSLSNLRQTIIDGDMRAVASDGVHLAALALNRGLVQLQVENGELVETGVLFLDGPKLDLVIRDGRAVAALGSAGVSVVSLGGDEPQLENSVVPPAVTTSADLHGDALAVTALTGVFLYDTRENPPRLAGFDHVEFAMLSGRFVGDDLVVSDWERVVRYTLNLNGEVTTLDSPAGLFILPDQPFRFPVHNIGGVPLHARLLGESADIEPGAMHYFELHGAEAMNGEVKRYVDMMISGEVDGEPFTTKREVAFAVRIPEEEWPETQPSIGDALPPIALMSATGDTFYLPEPGIPSRLVFFSFDCAAMWPELEDLAWAARSDLLDGTRPVFIADEISSDSVDQWGYNDLSVGFYGSNVPEEVQAFNARLGPELYDHGFWNLGQLPRTAKHPTDHVQDANGIVTAIDTRYRGLWPLR